MSFTRSDEYLSYFWGALIILLMPSGMVAGNSSIVAMVAMGLLCYATIMCWAGDLE